METSAAALGDMSECEGCPDRSGNEPCDVACAVPLPALAPDGGSSFAGDFIVASTSPDRRNLQVAVVDVSGKGEQAGTRSLLLSGAFGGLLGALAPQAFLHSANDYLLRQDWTEGFATAVHLSVDLDTGEFEIRSAGHPPAVQLLAGSGRWAVHDVEGPILGLMPEAEFHVVRGTLQRGDAILMFTDGLVETPQRDISLGIDRLVGQAERLLRVANQAEAAASAAKAQLTAVIDGQPRRLTAGESIFLPRGCTEPLERLLRIAFGTRAFEIDPAQE